MKISANMGNEDRDLSQYMEESDEDDDSTTRSNSPDYVSYRSRPEWADVEPISIKTRSSVMDIKYTAQYEEAFSYFRAVLVRDELSERSLALTADCIHLQRSNFSVWYFRRRILRKLTHHLPGELNYVQEVIEKEPKNYQVWHHRKTIVEWLQDGSSDKQLTASVLMNDSKNYHAWQHRQWVIKEFNLWDGELEFTDSMIEDDVSNNSAWNHRFFVLKETKRHEDSEWYEEEVQRVHKRIEQDPTNESPWSYLRGILLLKLGSLTLHDKTREFCNNLYAEKNCHSSHLLAFILDMVHEDLTRSSLPSRTDKASLKHKANQLCTVLSETDRVRSRYWNYVGLKMREL